MRNTTFLHLFLLSNALIACTDDPSPDDPIDPSTIHVTSGQPPELVAFREGVDGAWQAATKKTPTSYEFEVTGPYMVSVVCRDQALGELLTWQVARTPGDAREFSAPCGAAPSTHAITGHMVQAGNLKLGGSSDQSNTANWDFHLSAANGTYDLLAATDERIVLRRGIKIDGDTPMMPVDVVQQGTAFASVAFTIANAAQDELLNALVYLQPKTLASPALLYTGPIATAKVVPNEALVETDAQRATMLATKGTAARSFRRSFRAGGSTAYKLPSPIDGVQWAVEDGRVSASWTKLPDPDSLAILVDGTKMVDNLVLRHEMNVSSRFLADAKISRVTLDTNIPGYKPEWKIDFTAEYSRILESQSIENGGLATSSEGEVVNASGTSPLPLLRIARAHDRAPLHRKRPDVDPIDPRRQ